MRENSLMIRVENVKKQYRLGQIGGGTLRGDLQSWWARKRGKEDPNTLIGTDQRLIGTTFMALNGVSFTVIKGEAVGIIGANGAGKTTLMKSIMGLVPAKNGKIVWQDEEIQAKKTHHIVKRGISYVPEGREIFPGMTVLENMEMGAYTLRMSAKEKADKLNEMYELFPRLYERKKQKAGTLSGGEQQMVAIARGLMLSPKLLMMDEPSLGLAPIIVDEVFDIISRVNEKANIPVLLVEQNAYMALSISHRSYVLENGVIVDEGESKKLLASESIRTAYLGK